MATPLQYSCLENPMDRGVSRATVQGVTKSQTRLKRHKLMELPNTCHTCQFIYFSKKISYTKVFIFSVNFLQIFGLKSFLGIRIFWNHCIYLIFKIIFLIYICCWIELQVTFYVDFISLSLAKLT